MGLLLFLCPPFPRTESAMDLRLETSHILLKWHEWSHIKVIPNSVAISFHKITQRTNLLGPFYAQLAPDFDTDICPLNSGGKSPLFKWTPSIQKLALIFPLKQFSKISKTHFLTILLVSSLFSGETSSSFISFTEVPVKTTYMKKGKKLTLNTKIRLGRVRF